MTTKQIAAAAAKKALPFELAKHIREILDAAKKEYGSSWTDDDVEAKVQELVFGEE